MARTSSKGIFSNDLADVEAQQHRSSTTKSTLSTSDSQNSFDNPKKSLYGFLNGTSDTGGGEKRPMPKTRFQHFVQFLKRGRAFPYRELAIMTLWTAFIVPMAYLAGRNWGDHLTCRWFCTPLAVDSNVASYVGFALFLLLGFRVSEAYGRYMEGICIFNDEISGTIHVFITQISQTFEHGVFHPNDRERIFGLLAAYAVGLRQALREECHFEEFEPLLSPHDLDCIKKTKPDVPQYCLHKLNDYLVHAMKNKDLGLPGPWHSMMMKMVQALAGCQGKSMRIKNFQVAYGYIGYLQIFLIIWLFLLPLALVETGGWLTIFFAPLIAYGIVGMDQTARELSDPFGYDYNDIRIGDITEDIKANLRSVYQKSLQPSDLD